MAKIDTKKLLPNASKADKISSQSVESISRIASTLIDVDTIMKGSLLLEKMRAKKKQKAKQQKKRNLKEKARESLKNMGKGIKDKVKKVGGGMMDWLNKLIFGVVLISLFQLKDVIMPILPWIATAFDGLVMITGWVFNFASTLIHWSYKIYDGIRGFVGNIFGEAGLKVFDNLMSLLNTFMNTALMAVMTLLKFKWLRNFAKNIAKRIGKLIMRIPGVKKIVGNLTRFGRKAGILGKKLIGRGGRKLLKSIGQKGLKKTVTGGLKKVAAKGAQKVGGFAAKLFGKAAKVITPGFKAAKPFVSKFFGRVPIVGPLIVGIVSLLSGEGAGKAIFKMVGAALGGFLGGALAAGVTTATAGIGVLVAPAMTMLGELIGVFVGDMLYDLLFGGGLSAIMGKLKDLVAGVFQKALNVGTAIVDFIKDGFTNFIKDFPTIPIPDIKPGAILASIIEKVPFGKRILGLGVPFTDWNVKGMLNSLPGLQEFLGFFAQAVPGLNNYVEDGKLKRIPNLLMLTPYGMPFLIPHLKNSFFGSKEAVGDGPKGESKGGKGEVVGKTKKEKKKEEAAKKREELKKKLGGLKDKIGGVFGKIGKGLKNIGKKVISKHPAVIAAKAASNMGKSVSSYPSYDEMSAETALVPLPPMVLPVGGAAGGSSISDSSSSEDPFEAFYAHSGGVV